MSDQDKPESPDIKNVSDLASWIDFAKGHKNFCLDKNPTGDLPPTVVVERGGRVEAIVMAEQIDKNLGLHAARVLQCGFDPDAIILFCDARLRKFEKEEWKDLPEEEIKKRIKQEMKAGSMPKMAEENKEEAERLGITDCIICHRIDRKGKISMISLPYTYKDKNLQWLENDKKFGQSKEDKDEIKISGFIPDALRQIMQNPPIQNRLINLAKLQVKGFSADRMRFHVARASLFILAEQHFMVSDFISSTHPEWTDAKKHGHDLINHLIEHGLFPKESYHILHDIVEKHIGSGKFREEMTNCINSHSYWLPPDLRYDKNGMEEFLMMFESICMSPNLVDAGGAAHKFPIRVKVWNGDQTEYLGEGDYIGNVSVYFIEMPDGSLQTNDNPENEPESWQIPEGGTIRHSSDNPKIVLDSGRVVYGCQCWWVPKESKDKEKPCGYNKPKRATPKDDDI